MSLAKTIEALCKRAQTASFTLAELDTSDKNQAIALMAQILEDRCQKILAINQQEVTHANQQGLNPATVDRMTLSPPRFNAMIATIKDIITLPDPVGRILAEWQVPSGLKISRIAVPLGVIAVIYESRPNVTADAAILSLKAGNAIILRGGSECEQTNRALVEALQTGLQQAQLPPAAIQYVPEQQRTALEILLKMDPYIDVIIPRGGRALIDKIVATSRIPLFRHLDGICHTYIHQDADLAMAVTIICNAKMRRPGICGATETLLIDRTIGSQYLPTITTALSDLQCELRGDSIAQAIDPRIKAATDQDWRTEYLAPILAIKVVADIDAAIGHINHYGSQHTDAIITNNHDAAQQFLKTVRSANVMHNCSTQFADGGEFGMGAEIGIATGKLHARGPVGLEQLTTFQYWVQGAGQIRP